MAIVLGDESRTRGGDAAGWLPAEWEIEGVEAGCGRGPDTASQRMADGACAVREASLVMGWHGT